MFPRRLLAPVALLAAGLLGLGPLAAQASAASAGSRATFLGPLHAVSTVSTTVPFNGDENPYGTAVIPTSTGRLNAGWVLVSNFNDSANAQGTGTTIVQVAPWGAWHVFAHITRTSVHGGCPGGIGLTTALVALRSGWVVVGSLPTRAGSSATAGAGCLIFVNPMGEVAGTISGAPINGPWDMTAADFGSTAALFVTNVLNGTVAANGALVDAGTVVRIWLSIPASGLPTVTSETVIGAGFAERTDPAALVIGPTGVGLGADGTLYVADSLESRIAGIPDALSRATSANTGNDVASGGALSDPLGLTVAPNGDVVTVNGNNGKVVEITPAGAQVAVRFLDKTGTPPGNGALFGLAIRPGGSGLYFVDDDTNTLNLLS